MAAGVRMQLFPHARRDSPELPDKVYSSPLVVCVVIQLY